ncbi:MAG TPA: hypothetical protein VM553_17285 [Dongiaceae bacterium]|nr:hypothetical protein [Dongiaceae bacterium]
MTAYAAEDHYLKSRPARLPPTTIQSLRIGPMSEAQAPRFDQLNKLLDPGYQAVETGYCQRQDGSWYVAVKTDFPGTTGPMLDWWFCWHTGHSNRYRIWHPTAHTSAVSTHPERYDGLSRSNCKLYVGDTHHVVEDIGTGDENLSIRFVSPDAFGFDTSRFAEAGIETAICGYVGRRYLPAEFIRMTHLVRRTESGCEMRSRFWVGEDVQLKFGRGLQGLVNRGFRLPGVRQALFPNRLGFHLAMHCAQEYHHLSGLLPQLYREFAVN